MGNGYSTGNLDDIAQMRALIEGITLRLTELEKPMGGLQIAPPIALAAIGNSSGSLGVSTTFTTIATAVINVPAGYTQAVVYASTQAQAQCSINGDYLYLECMVTASSTGHSPWNDTGGVPSQSSTGTLYGFAQFPQTYTSMSDTFVGLSGGTLTATCRIKSQVGAWTASPSTGGTVSIQAIFLP